MFFKTDYPLMQAKVLQNAPKGAFCNIFDFIKLPFVFKTFVLSIFEWPLKTGFTVNEKVAIFFYKLSLLGRLNSMLLYLH